MAKTFRLSNLTIDDVSSVDAGAGEGVRVMLMKRDTADNNQEETDMNTDTISKAGTTMHEDDVIALAKSGSMSRSDLYEVINKRADARAQQRRAYDESRQQAFVHFIERDPLGVELYKIYRALPVQKAVPHVTAADPSPPHGGGGDDPLTQLREMAEQFRQTPAGKGMTPQQALAHIADTPEGRPLFAASNAENLRKQFALTA